MMKKNNSYGFVITGVMIFIMTIGALGLITSGITSSQIRANDAVNQANLANIAMALELYYYDNDSYPSAPRGVCLDPNELDTTKISAQLGKYMKGGKVPAPASTTQETLKCKGDSTGKYYYQSLSYDGVEADVYILAISVESWKAGNLVVKSNDVQIGNSEPNKEVRSEDITTATIKTSPATSEKALYVITPF